MGFPNKLTLEQRSQFPSADWLNLAQAAGIKIYHSSVKSHNKMIIGEMYHAYLGRFYEKVRLDPLILSRKIALKLANKATNDTTGPAGLIPSVVRVVPRLSVHSVMLPSFIERMKDVVSARKTMVDIVAKQGLITALYHHVPSVSNAELRNGDEV